jgi:quinoprotein relay system zinc metallohydrolase 2
MGAADPRTALRLLACLLAFAAGRGNGFDLAEPEPKVFVHLGRHLALDVPGHDDIANIGFIIGAKCVAVIDTGGSATSGRELRAAIGKYTALPVCYVINTHAHVDHVLGNGAFSGAGVSFVGHALLGAAIARSREFFVREYAGDLDSPPSAGQVIGPDRLVERELTLDLGERPLLLRAWPTAHSDCDLTVYDTNSGTLWTGDLLFRERLPALDGSLDGWLSALDELERMKVKLAVPGHGRLTRDLRSAIAPERRYLKALGDGVRDELAHSKSMDDAIERVAAGERPHWLLWGKVHPHNVVRAYQELEWE